MPSNIVKSDDYFTIKHNSEILDNQELELAYSQLTDMVLYNNIDYKIGICDFSSIKTLAVTEDEFQKIIDALVYIFHSKPDFHFITVAPESKVKETANNMNKQLRDEYELKNLYSVSAIESALQLVHQIGSS